MLEQQDSVCRKSGSTNQESMSPNQEHSFFFKHVSKSLHMFFPSKDFVKKKWLQNRTSNYTGCTLCSKQQQVNTGEGISNDNSLPSLSGLKTQDF
jgi:hypothetical protein